MDINSKLEAIRSKMKINGIDAYIIGTADPHQSEYPPSFWAGRQWVSGFDGSAGTVIISQDHAGLWTDSRYFQQAELQLANTPFVLHKLQVQTQSEYIDWICNEFKAGQTVGVDFWCFSLNQIHQFDKLLSTKGIKFKDCGDLLMDIWPDRPPLSKTLIYEHDIKYAGQTRKEKIDLVREEMARLNANISIVSALDEIGYILNLRGNDVHCNPVFVAYLVIQKENSILFIDEQKLEPWLKNQLSEDRIFTQDYKQIVDYITKLDLKQKVLIDHSTLNAKLTLMLAKDSLIPSESCIMRFKSIKNEIEISHIRRVMQKDGVALVKSFRWLEAKLTERDYPTEYEFAMRIKEFRAEQEGYVNESFDAIIGYKGNGSIIHYRPEKDNCEIIKPEGVLLCDSGGQYLDGTTDITRTIALGPIDEEIKIQNTAVLMGHISLARLIFPTDTKGIQFDILARQHLWQLGLNYNHGTGHGVGFFMNVHEPPQGFVSVWNQRGSASFKAGMLTSNEPGYYQVGSYGIRIENLVLTIPHSKNEYGEFLQFESVSLFPIDVNMIHLPMLDKVSLQWLNTYHAKVFNDLSPWLNTDERKWLEEKCKPL